MVAFYPLYKLFLKILISIAFIIFNNICSIMEKNSLQFCNSSTCQHHAFSLTPLNRNKEDSIMLRASYCQQQRNASNSNKRPSCCLNCPTFNRDHDFRTPAFVVRQENNGYNSSSKTQIRFIHEGHLDYSNDEKSLMYVAKPRSKNSYCSVCRVTFQDYRTHIYTSEHKAKIKGSPFNPLIEELAHQYNQHKRVSGSKNRTRKTHYLPITENQDSDEVQIIENPPRKIRHSQRASQCQTKLKDLRKWKEQVPINYAKQLVDTFRGANREQMNQNYNTFAHFYSMMTPLFPNYSNYSFQTNQATALPQNEKGKGVKKLTYIIIDE